ncbi:hypothetical protein A8B79_03875 [Balneola sp. EhC07]|uniref:hypothetical protein n=1 Tax=Balneola sp. EhC07 TaxID=1849360 RepID=UPI0007F43E29|nr:hypothetical protein [Balneola sp. EhC07]OAN62089.1 hypothetical protein A8B79_03875 [Balneola sp. EhC07]
MKKAFLVLLVLGQFISCQSRKEQSHFLDTKVQHMEQRNLVSGELNLEFEKDLDDVDIFNYKNIVELDSSFLLAKKESSELVFLDKTTLNLNKSFRIKEGRGPKEVEYIMAFDANEDMIVVADNKLLKILQFDHDGNLIREFKTKEKIPHRLSLSSDNSMHIMNEVFFDDLKDGFLENITILGDKNYTYAKENLKDLHPFGTEGNIKSVKDTVYYLGAYEPFIKKYLNGEQIYSRSTLDNYDTSVNYITVISNDSRSTSLSPAAIFSSRDFDVKKGSIFVIPYSNGDNDFSFIDVYASKDGSYIKSFRTIDVPDKINVYEEERSILTIEKVGDLEKPVFRKYSY